MVIHLTINQSYIWFWSIGVLINPLKFFHCHVKGTVSLKSSRVFQLLCQIQMRLLKSVRSHLTWNPCALDISGHIYVRIRGVKWAGPAWYGHYIFKCGTACLKYDLGLARHGTARHGLNGHGVRHGRNMIVVLTWHGHKHEKNNSNFIK